jgi:hypothetical protein
VYTYVYVYVCVNGLLKKCNQQNKHDQQAKELGLYSLVMFLAPYLYLLLRDKHPIDGHTFTE